MTEQAKRTASIAVLCVLLACATFAAFLPVLQNSFINYDDPEYITNNPRVRAGLTHSGVAWAFTAFHAGNWHPLTWLSHMFDCQLHGLEARGHHLTGLLFHCANTALLFLLLNRLTGAMWRSALIAALFGLHPLHVESVAWASERKDVLSTLFGLVALMAYVRYVSGVRCQVSGKNSGSEVQGLKSKAAYGLAVVLFALGLMSKPMLVTLPILLLLLDYWPLQRVSGAKCQVSGTDSSGPDLTLRTSHLTLLLEKVPFFILSAGSCVITVLAQRHGGAVTTVTEVPMGLRVENAIVSCAVYVGKLFWPANLAAYYPMPESIPATSVALAAVFLLVISWLAFKRPLKRPALTVGWSWYLVTLLPVIGLVQVGLQSRADRYTYFPSIGLLIALAWVMEELSRNWKRRQILFAAVSVGVLGLCGVMTFQQARLWRDSETIFAHTVAVVPNNPVARLNLGSALVERGAFAEAAAQFAEVVRLKPGYAEAHNNLGFALAMQGRVDEAVGHYRTALKLKPRMERTRSLLAGVLFQQGEHAAAIVEYRTALEINPDWPAALNDLAWILATDPDAARRDGPEAVKLAERLCQVTEFREPQFIGTLGAAYAEAGRFDEAASTAQRAIDLAKLSGRPDLEGKNRELLELYRSGKAYHEPARTNR